ncbi:MAG: hypothetical protein ACYTBZ_25605 [Planctomycetota bacterium]|jgi:hypothetical protein
MKVPALITLLLTLLFCAVAHCQEAEGQELRELESAERHSRQKVRQLELEERRMELHRQRASKKHKKCWKHKDEDNAALLLIIIAIVHILTAVWVFQDIRKRGVGSGIWIVIALLTGLLGTLVYAVVRLGDTRQTPK